MESEAYTLNLTRAVAHRCDSPVLFRIPKNFKKPSGVLSCENNWFPVGYNYGVLELCHQTVIGGLQGPAIPGFRHKLRFGGNKGFYGKNKAGSHQPGVPFVAVIQYVRGFLVKLSADPVAAQVFDHGKPIGASFLIYGFADKVEPAAGPRPGDAFHQGRL